MEFKEIIYREAVYFWYYFTIQFNQIFLYWILGIFIGSFISVFVKERIYYIFQFLANKTANIFAIIVSSAFGILSPLCMYGTIPIAASLYEKGMKEDLLASFMVSSILLNPQLIIYSMALGKTVLAIRIISCFLCGICAGLLVRFFYSKKKFFNFSSFYESKNRDVDPNVIIRLLKNILRNVKATGLYFLIGIILSALFQRYVDPEAFASLFGIGNKGFGILLASTIGVPLYVCGGGTVPLILSWLQTGMSVGSAAAFMITGPATKITNLGALKIVLGIKNFIIYFIYIMSFSFLTGFFIDYVFKYR